MLLLPLLFKYKRSYFENAVLYTQKTLGNLHSYSSQVDEAVQPQPKQPQHGSKLKRTSRLSTQSNCMQKKKSVESSGVPDCFLLLCQTVYARRPSIRAIAIAGRFSSGSIGLDDAVKLFDELLPLARPASVRAFNQLLTVVSRAKGRGSSTSALVVSLFNRMARASPTKEAPDLRTYSKIIGSFCSMGHLDFAFAGFGLILKKGFRVDAIVINQLLNGLCDAKRMGEAMDVMACAKLEQLRGLRMRQQGLSPNVVNYGALIDALCKLGRVDEAMLRCNQMINEGVTPNIIVFTSLVYGLCTVDKWEKADELFSEMLNQGIYPNATFFNTIMRNLCNEGRVMEAQSLVDLMVRLGVRPDVISYNTLIDGYCLAGRMEEAMKLLDVMVSAGLEPDVVAYNTLLHGYCRAGRIYDAFRLFRQMLSNAVTPGVATYNTILHGLFQYGRFSEAKELYLNMIKSGMQLDIYTCNIMLNGLCKNNFLDDAFEMFQSLCSMDSQLDIITFNIMIDALLKSGRKEDAMGMLTAISAHGLVPDVVTYRLVTENLIKEGLLEEFDNLFLAMEKSGCTPNSGMLNAIIRRLLDRGEIMRAGVYLSKIDEKNFSLEASTTSLLLSVFSREEYRHHAKSLPEKFHFLWVLINEHYFK
ncbi:uncharacterized protein [Setaria viridis]|uniref:uncharacterized protein n=1 Tax=Setaria viridis TaxID=4556 RepID=UPI003B3B8AD0